MFDKLKFINITSIHYDLHNLCLKIVFSIQIKMHPNLYDLTLITFVKSFTPDESCFNLNNILNFKLNYTK
jgi:hypothetical protein